MNNGVLNKGLKMVGFLALDRVKINSIMGQDVMIAHPLRPLLKK